MQSWCKTWLLNRSSRIRAKQKLHRNPKGACKSSWSRKGSHKSVTLTIPCNLARLVKIFPGIIARLHCIDQKQMGLLREQHAEWRKAPLPYCNQIWMKIGGQILWNAFPICETFKIYYLMGRLHTKDVLDNHLKNQSFHLVHWLSITLSLRKTSQESHQFGKKVLPGLFLGYALYAGWIWKGDMMVADIEELETMDASEIYLEKTQCKGSNIHQKMDFFQSEMDESKPWRRSGTENIHLGTASTNSRRGSHWLSWRIRSVSSTNLKTHFRMAVKPLTIFGPCQEASYTAITLKPESNFTRRERNRSLFHWSTLTSPELHFQTWMFCRKAASMIIGISMGLEACLILGQVSHNLLCWKKNLLTDTCGPGGDWRENSLHPDQIIYGQNSGNQWESTPSWRRSKSGLRKSSTLKTHENCEGSISSTWRIRNSKKPSRTRVRSWKHQWLLLCPVKLRKIVGVVHPTKLRQNLRVFWKLMNPQECVWEIRYRIITKTILQEKVKIHNNTIWSTKLFLCLKQWRFLQRKQRTRKGKISEKISAWNLTKVRSKKEVIDEARTKGIKVHSASLMDICHLKNAELETKHQKYKGRVVLRGDIVKDDSGSYAVFTEQRSSASQMTAAKVIDVISRLPGAQDKQLTQYRLKPK